MRNLVLILGVVAVTACTHKVEISNAHLTGYSGDALSEIGLFYGGNPERERALIDTGNALSVVFSADEDLGYMASERQLVYFSAVVHICGKENIYFFGTRIYQFERSQNSKAYVSIVPQNASDLDYRKSSGEHAYGWPIDELADEDVCFKISGGDMVFSVESNSVQLGTVEQLYPSSLPSMDGLH